MIRWNRRRPTTTTPPAAARRPVSIGSNALNAAAPQPITAIDLEIVASPDCPCGQRATYIVLVHEVDSCEPLKDGDCEELTPDGDDILMRCNACLHDLTDSISREIARRIAKLPKGERLACGTCGRPIACLHDVLETEAL